MFLFKYERLIHDSIGFDSFLLDPETKLKGRVKWSFSQDFRQPFAQASNQLTWDSYNSPGQVSTFSIKQATRLSECSSPG